MLRDAAEVLGADRQAALCRELTKKFEEVLRGTLAQLAEELKESPRKGEMVVLIDRAGERIVHTSEIESRLRAVLGEMSVRDAADTVAGDLGLKRRQVYQLALQMQDGS
jgi:16S rRNA (cytidine1402-2'-O)-methyltransferase